MTLKPQVSFEFFPPKTEETTANLMTVAKNLSAMHPAYMTVTYGAGGSTRDKTLETALAIAKQSHVSIATHLTYINTPISEMEAIADNLWNNGIRHIVALRGDMPQGLNWPLEPDAEYFQYTDEFVRKLRRLHDFEISVGAYPEKHPDAPDLSADIEALRKKCAAGARRAITQFFFNNEVYFNFIDQCGQAGITTPIVPGILPIANYQKMLSFAKTCGAQVPNMVREKFENADEADHPKISQELLIGQCEGLIQGGVGHIHFYTLNQSDLCLTACEALGLAKENV